MALTDLTRISTSGIATGTSLSGAILHGDAHFRGTQVGVNSAMFDSSDDALEFNDNVKLTFGNGGDLKLYHTGSHSYIQESGSGDLVILSNQVAIRNSAENEDLARFIENTGVQLYDGANTVRLATNDNGVVVTGILTATTFSGPTVNTSGISTFYDLRVSNNLTVEGSTTTLDTNLIGVDRVEVGANSNTVTGIAVTQSGTADLVRLYDGASQVVTVDDVGNVGIGSAIPGVLLDVQGHAGSGAQNTIRSKSTAANASNFVRSESSDGLYIGLLKYGTGHSAYGALPAGGGAVYANSSVPITIMSDGGSGYINFATGGNTERLRIHADGEVAIAAAANGQTVLSCLGAYASSSTVDIQTWARSDSAVKAAMKYSHGTNSMNFGTTTNHPLIFQVNNTERIRIDSDGNILLKDAAGQGNSLVHYIRANDSSGNSQYQLGMVSSGNEDLYLIQSRNANLRFQTSGSSRWLIDGDPGHLLPAVAGAVNIGSASAEIGDIYFANSKGLKLGNSQVGDLYNDGTDTYFRNSVSNGQTLIRSGGNIWISDYSGNHRAAFRDNSSVDLYFDIENNATAKLSTTVKGISVHGEVAASQDYPNIQPTLDLNFAAVKKLDPRITFYRTTTGSYIDENGDYRWASANEPRFDHDEVTHESKGLLMEVARTNKLSSGNNIPSGSNSGGSPGPSLVANNVEAPDGSFTARTIDYSNASSNMNSANIEFGGWDSDPSGKTYSASIWVKGIAGQHINFYLDASGQGSSNTGKGNFTLTGKWQRLSVYHTYPAGSNAAYLRCGSRNLQTGVEGTATVTSFWGTTIVEESQPGSTIATPIVPVTTTPDYALIDGEEFSEFYSPLEHTTVMIGQRASNVAGADGRLYTISDGSSSQVAPDWDFDDGTKLRFSTNVGGSTQTLQRIESWSGINDEFKIAAGIALNNQIGVVNGVAIAAADTSCAIPTGVDRLYFGLRGDGGNQGSLTIKRFIFYPKRLPDSQLVTLTS